MLPAEWLNRYMLEDLDIFDWNLTASEMATLSAVAPHKPEPHPRPPAPPPAHSKGRGDGTMGAVAVAVVLAAVVVAVALEKRKRRGRGSELLQEHLDSNLDRGPDDNNVRPTSRIV